MSGFSGPVKRAAFDVATAGDNTLVAAVAGKAIRVLALFLDASGGPQDARFEDGAGGGALTGVLALDANGQMTLPYNPAGWFETSPGTLLNLELSTATDTAGVLVYVEV